MFKIYTVCVCIYIYIINKQYTYKTKRLFWMRLIAINHLTALLEMDISLQSVYLSKFVQNSEKTSLGLNKIQSKRYFTTFLSLLLTIIILFIDYLFILWITVTFKKMLTF